VAESREDEDGELYVTGPSGGILHRIAASSR
jgi:hypothetical protein